MRESFDFCALIEKDEVIVYSASGLYTETPLGDSLAQDCALLSVNFCAEVRGDRFGSQRLSPVVLLFLVVLVTLLPWINCTFGKLMGSLRFVVL
ncbi:hypothetical protein ACQ4N7_04010 [Nodosilinea sp. AN01ver1]|uniref:hypothetical protein n=1 Tax=Nodosilinea sp. AN01ver1 TaxID=3423362 RepID=UPI003D3151E3